MTELETLRRAQTYIAQLAQGVDPLSGEELPEDALLNNPRLVRCFFYVARVLEEDLARAEKGEKGAKRGRKAVFFLTDEEKAAFPISKVPVTITVFAQALNEAAGEERKRLPATAITSWLVEKGFLREEVNTQGKKHKTVTPESASVGITEEERQGLYGMYATIYYSAEAQQFLLDNLDDIIAHHEG